MNYLENMTLRLATGLGQLPDSIRDSHTAYILNAQQPDGGYRGRESGSDLYYTSFALRGLAISGMLHGPSAERAAIFLRDQLDKEIAVVDLIASIYSVKLLQVSAGLDVLQKKGAAWHDRLVEFLNSCQRPDGGYARGPDNPRSSTYQTFLSLICFELLNARPKDPEATIRFLKSQQRDDGGFVEFAPMRRSGTNPTAAAIGGLKILDQIPDALQTDVAEFLVGMQTSEGGLRANTRIPIADLLSSFTGLFTLVELGEQDRLQLDQLAHFVSQLAENDSGFCAALWDTETDVEYTFYGLGSLALLATLGKFDRVKEASHHR
ncbi:MAG: prenyltransferase/squalene oxidase repeat-containing protein [Planctomycetota bacterium]|nr:prenyltransferase/squalene oxidase repeat-containing protein [Planctomycetota bacterium]